HYLIPSLSVRMHAAANGEHFRIRMCEVGDACGHKQREKQQENPASRPCDAASWHEQEHRQNDQGDDQTAHSWSPLHGANSSRVTRSAHLMLRLAESATTPRARA